MCQQESMFLSEQYASSEICEERQDDMTELRSCRQEGGKHIKVALQPHNLASINEGTPHAVPTHL